MSDANFAEHATTMVSVSVAAPTGTGARDPCVLLNETAHQLYGRPLVEFAATSTFDTYTGPQWAYPPGPVAGGRR